MKSMNYLFLLSFLVGHASFVCAMDEESVANGAARPVESFEAMKARHLQEIQEFEKKRQDKVDKYNKEFQEYQTKKNDSILARQNAAVNLNHGTTNEFRSDNNYDDIAADQSTNQNNTLEELGITRIDLNTKSDALKKEYLKDIEQLRNTQAEEIGKHPEAFDRSLKLTKVEKTWYQKIMSSLGFGDVGIAVDSIKNIDKSNPADDLSDKNKNIIKTALKNLDGDQRVQVLDKIIRSYSTKGRRDTFVEFINKILPDDEQVRLTEQASGQHTARVAKA